MRKNAFEHKPLLGCHIIMNLLNLPVDEAVKAMAPYATRTNKVSSSKATLGLNRRFTHCRGECGHER